MITEPSLHRNEYENALWKVQGDTICLFTGTRRSQDVLGSRYEDPFQFVNEVTKIFF